MVMEMADQVGKWLNTIGTVKQKHSAFETRLKQVIKNLNHKKTWVLRLFSDSSE